MKAENRLVTQLNGICKTITVIASATNHAKELSAKASVKGLSDEERRHTARRLEIVVESLGPITEDLKKLQKSIQPTAISRQQSAKEKKADG